MTVALLVLAWCGLLYWAVHAVVAICREFSRD